MRDNGSLESAYRRWLGTPARVGIMVLALLMVGWMANSYPAFAENVPLDPAGPAGDLTVVEAVAPLGQSLTYDSGGNGLIGRDGVWPILGHTPASAVNSCDHVWLQYDPAIIWQSRFQRLNRVFAVPGIDHDPLPGEALEFFIEGSNDALAWERGRIVTIYRDGFDVADTVLGHSDDYTSLWQFSRKYQFFRAISGDFVEGFDSPGEGEIDCLTAAPDIVTTKVRFADDTPVPCFDADCGGQVGPEGSVVHDLATVTSDNLSVTPTGSVTFAFYMGNLHCSLQQPTSLESVALAGSGGVATARSSDTAPLAAGSYSYKAIYLPDDAAKALGFETTSARCEQLGIVH